MLTPNERYQIIVRLSRVQHESIWGLAIAKFNQRAFAHTDAEVLRTVTDLQSQIDDNPAAMKDILGEQFAFIDAFRRKETLNIQENTRLLLVKALQRFPAREQQAKALGLTVRTLQNYLVDYNLLNVTQ
jgi:hypothetical protein